MKALLAASLLALSTFSAAQSTTPKSAAPQVDVEGLVALARVYGVARYFHPSDSVEQVKWDRFLVHAAGRLGTARGNDEIGARLQELFAPVVTGFRVAPAGATADAPPGEGPHVEWRHLGYGMEPDASSPYASWRTHHAPLHGGGSKGGYFQHRALAERPAHVDPVWRIPVAQGLEAHVPVSLPRSSVKVGDAQKASLDALDVLLAKVEPAGETVTRAQAHADGIAAWNVARHFYPYWGEVRVDWEARLREWLARQPERQSRAQLRDALRGLVAPLDDGHARIVDPADKAPRAALPISVRPLGDRWVVDASQAPSVRAGDVIVAVDGRPAAAWFDARMALISGTPRYKRWLAAHEFAIGERGRKVALTVLRGKERHQAALAFEAPRPMQGPRPEPLAEVAPGVRYVDVSRFDKAAFEKAMPQLAAAKAIVFDLRGYPGRDAVQLVQHWIGAREGAQWMFVPRFDKPNGEAAAAWSFGWQASPSGALAAPAKVLVTDARAVGYAESLAAYFPDQKVGPVVGEATAGTNGNVIRATLPSGMVYFFTAMRVTRHDGATPVHGKGIPPDVAAAPTVEGIRAGRDEVLERAIAVALDTAKGTPAR